MQLTLNSPAAWCVQCRAVILLKPRKAHALRDTAVLMHTVLASCKSIAAASPCAVILAGC
jgi:hypothetical protein